MSSPTFLVRVDPSSAMRSVARSLLTMPTRRSKHGQGKVKTGRKIFKTAKCVLLPNKLEKAFEADTPLRMKRMFEDLPAYQKWISQIEESLEDPDVPRSKFRRGSKQTSLTVKTTLNNEYLEQFGDMSVPLERSEQHPQNGTTFDRFDAPFSFLLEFMKAKAGPTNYRLYLAQHSLSDLPEAMRADLPTPDIMKSLGGKGDIYGSSLWMGKAPTRTPLHRDPNPNLFVQISGRKTVRLMRPEVGKELYEKVRAMYNKSGGSANLRGEEMMQGEEFNALERAVWGDKSSERGQSMGVEATLKKGDGLYIPKGWWHAVRGEGKGPIISVNWWFR
ncbi:hypothetical protein DE146DRAFT_30297 [Phaeosphaeria sp. MPI-PUGE-AT-0046c]|nr:hypothetical protein DE146DRAFT_30297 [Phaeosphaeria sp. MPI-PUGE-AT-0046c]